MDFLTDDQRASFAEINARVGLGPLEYTCQNTADQMASFRGLIHMSTTNADSHFEPHYVPVGSVQDMRKIAGTKSGLTATQGNPIKAPQPPSKDELDALSGLSPTELKAKVSGALLRRIEEAATIYVLGNDSLVADYTDLINAVLYPGRIAVYTGHTLTISDGGTLHIDGDEPAFLNFGQLRAGKDATLRITTQFAINFQKSVESS